eukprot:5264937-Pyramimonas_sp.AAC.1
MSFDSNWKLAVNGQPGCRRDPRRALKYANERPYGSAADNGRPAASATRVLDANKFGAAVEI